MVIILDGYELQQMLLKPGSDGTIHLPSGEFEGPFMIDRPCRIIGNSTTLWRSKGTILTVKCAGVVLENLRIEITNDNNPPSDCIAVYSKTGDTVYKDVEIIGRLVGMTGEDEPWGIPKLVSLGKIPAEKTCTYKMDISAPVEAELVPVFYDITVSPQRLTAGMNTVTLTTQPIRNGSFIYGELLLKSAVTRRIYVSGSATENAEDYTDGETVFSADLAELEKQRKDFSEEIIYPDIIAPPDTSELYKPEAVDYDDEVPKDVTINRGMHVPINCSEAEIELVYDNREFPMDVDVFAFLADKKSNVVSNDRFVFFGNDHSACGTVRYLNVPDKKAMYIKFDNAPFDVRQIDIAYSIYENLLNLNFSNLKNPAIEIRFSNGQVIRYKLEGSIAANTLVGVGIEFTAQSRWELTPYGMIYPRGLAKLCGNYGLTIAT